ncbi:TRAP transporter small permease [Pseudomonas citronellolis]|uniref:TRAP transporter small permease n=1 Tax=Pseudomonas citronellolis TaxID=53408 RepID=UPI0023E44F10|nr:TRAP transporter small permease [Pseudomonas citronellolis]MDF3931407.1 TRAP transporter small permease [Pseudomonas citronellolis]
MSDLLPLEDAGAARPMGPPLRLLDALALGFAYLGGALLLALVGMSLVSIVGRKLWSAPITGDMELLEMGAAVAIAAFLPLCEIRNNHIRVEMFSNWMPLAARRALDALAHLLFALVAGVLAWRTALQALEAHANQDSSTLLALPHWIPLALVVPSLALLGLCALCRSLLALVEEGAGR